MGRGFRRIIRKLFRDGYTEPFSRYINAIIEPSQLEELEKIALEFIRNHKDYLGQKGFRGYPIQNMVSDIVGTFIGEYEILVRDSNSSRPKRLSNHRNSQTLETRWAQELYQRGTPVNKVAPKNVAEPILKQIAARYDYSDKIDVLLRLYQERFNDFAQY